VFKNRAVIGFQADEPPFDFGGLKEVILDEVRKTFRPEFLNRIDEVIVFHPLSENDLRAIVDLEISKVSERLAEQGRRLQVTDEVKTFLMKEGTNPQFGARPLRRTIVRHLEDPLSEYILKDEIPEQSVVIADLKNGRIVFRATSEGVPRENGTPSAPLVSH